ncbi:MAG: thioredoxin family protein [Candidatus Bathyarchaeota archaeon]|nr:MAG: thioredoxin family protein [Candidatus Bathyarchaeota archaeon]
MVKIEVYFSPICPHCPGAKSLITKVASKFDGKVKVEEINTFTEEGMKRGMANNVMAVPTVFIDGEQKFVGYPFSEEDLEASIRTALSR